MVSTTQSTGDAGDSTKKKTTTPPDQHTDQTGTHTNDSTANSTSSGGGDLCKLVDEALSDCWSGVTKTTKAAWSAVDSATSKLLDDPSNWNFGFESSPTTKGTSTDTTAPATTATDNSKKSDGFFDGFLDMINPFSSSDKKPAPTNDANGNGKDDKMEKHEAWYNKAVDSVWNAVFGSDDKAKEVSKTGSDGSKTTVTDGHMARDNKDGSHVDINTKDGTKDFTSADKDIKYHDNGDGTGYYENSKTGAKIERKKDGSYTVKYSDGTENPLDVKDVSEKGIIDRLQHLDVWRSRMSRWQIEQNGGDQDHKTTTSTDGWMINQHQQGHGKTFTNNDGRVEVDTEHGRLSRNKDGQWEFTEGTMVQGANGEWTFKAKEGGRVQKWQTFEEMRAALHHLPDEFVSDGHGGVKVKGTGTTVSSDTKVETAQGTVTNNGDGKQVMTTPDGDGHGNTCTLTQSKDGADLHCDGQKGFNSQMRYEFDSSGQVSGFKMNDVRNDGVQLDTYDSSTGTLSADGITFTPNGVDLGFCDGEQLDNNGNLYDSSGNSIYDSDDAGSAAIASQAQSVASSVVGSVASKSVITSNEVAALQSALGQLDNMLAVAFATGNLDNIGSVYIAQGAVSSALNDAIPKAAVFNELDKSGLSFDAASAQHGLSTGTVDSVVKEQRRIHHLDDNSENQ